MAVFFTLLLLIVQVGFLVTSRSMVAASVDAAARRGASTDAAPDDQADRVRAEIERSVPGAEIESIVIDRSPAEISVTVVFRWRPPGPDLLPVVVAVERTRTRVIPP